MKSATLLIFIYALIFIVGGVYAFIVPFYPSEQFIFLKPVLLVLFYMMYVMQTKLWNLPLMIALLFVLFGEYFATKGFVEYYTYVILFFVVYFFMAVYLISPVIRKTKLRKKYVDFSTILLGGFGMVFLFYFVFISTLSHLDELLLNMLALFSFSFFVLSIFYIALFNKSPKNALIFLTGLGYLVVILGYLSYEFLIDSNFILSIVNLSEVVAQFSFISYLIVIHEIKGNETKNFIY